MTEEENHTWSSEELLELKEREIDGPTFFFKFITDRSSTGRKGNRELQRSQWEKESMIHTFLGEKTKAQDRLGFTFMVYVTTTVLRVYSWLYSEIIPYRLRGPSGVPGTKPRSAGCKERALLTVLYYLFSSLVSRLNCISLNEFHALV